MRPSDTSVHCASWYIVHGRGSLSGFEIRFNYVIKLVTFMIKIKINIEIDIGLLLFLFRTLWCIFFCIVFFLLLGIFDFHWWMDEFFNTCIIYKQSTLDLLIYNKSSML
jgi:hypothetical protein